LALGTKALNALKNIQPLTTMLREQKAITAIVETTKKMSVEAQKLSQPVKQIFKKAGDEVKLLEGVGRRGISSVEKYEGIKEKIHNSTKWVSRPSKKGGGIVFQNPKNPHNIIRQMPGNPKSPNKAQQNPYIIFKKNGQAYDCNGNVLSSATNENAHIPLEKFDIGKMPKIE
jgi:hypothetical protein